MKKILFYSALCMLSFVTNMHSALSITQPELEQQLFSAVLFQDIEKIQQLVKLGANINTQTEYGDTTLTIATLCDHPETVRLLLADPRIDVNAQNEHGLTALMWAVCNDLSEIVPLLLADPRIDVNPQDKFGDTALMKAVRKDSLETARLLLADPRIDVNAQDKYGKTALMWAAKRGYDEIASTLIVAGANLPTNVAERKMLTSMPMAQLAIELKNFLNQGKELDRSNPLTTALYNAYERSFPGGLCITDTDQTVMATLFQEKKIETMLSIEFGLMFSNSRSFIKNNFLEIYKEYQTLSGKRP